MPSDPKQPIAATLVICAIFFLSGASALILEIAWTRQLDLLLGNSVYAATAMIAVYMLGLGIGSRFGAVLARRAVAPLKTYFVLEALLIAWALAVPLLFMALYALFPLLAAIPGLNSDSGTPTLLRLLGSVAIFAVPTLLMGATLPVLTHAVASRAAGFAARFSFLYGANTLGAVAGTLTAGFVLIPRFGITKTVLLALSLNAVAGIAALLLSKVRAFNPNAPPDTRHLTPDTAPSTPHPSPPGPRPSALVALAAAAGFLALYLEIFWFRTLILVFGSTTYSLSAMLGIFLAGTACGPLLLGWLGDRAAVRRHIPAIAGLCFFVTGITVVFSLNQIGRLPEEFLERLAAEAFSWKQLVTSKFVLSIRIIFLPALFLSAVLPLCAKAIRAQPAPGTPPPGKHKEPDEASDQFAPFAPAASADAVARVYLANTFGATAGAILGGLVFLPVAGLYYGILGAGIACLIMAITGVSLAGNTPRLRTLLPVLTVFIALIWFVFKEPWDRKKFALGAYFHPGAHSQTGRVRFDEALETSHLRVYEEGVAATVAVLESHDNAMRYTSNGKVEADTRPRAMVNQRLLGHLPMLLHPGEPKKIMNIGLGAGITLGALGQHPGIEALDVLEIEPAVILVADAFSRFNHDVLRHPALHIHFNDARNFLLTTKNRYDVICSDPFEPVVASAIHLFTKEHFQLARSRLADDGILCQWIPMYELSLEDYTTLVGTFVSVFPQSLYFSTGADSILIGFNDRVRVSPETVARRLTDPKVSASLAEIGLTRPEHFWGMLIADFTSNPLPRPAKLNTDDHPYVEFTAPRNALEQNQVRNRRLQLDLFEAGREKGKASGFISAFSDAERATIESQQNALQFGLRAGFELANGDSNAALDLAAKAGTLAPDNPIVRGEIAQIHHDIGNILLKQGDQDTALALLKSAYEHQPSTFSYHYRLALAYLRRGDSAQAAPLLVAGMKQFPESPFFYSLQGSLSVEAGKYQQALAFHKIAIEKAPGLDHLWEQYERAAQLGGNDQALTLIKEQRRTHTE